MDVETWKAVWKIVFFAASIMFYATVIVVGYKGFGDVVEMIRTMTAGKSLADDDAN
jgi:hypothetical protein